MSRIHYRGKLFDYPLKAGNGSAASAWSGGPLRLLVRLARVNPPKDQSHLDAWVTARFGKRCSRSSSRPTPRRLGMSTAELPRLPRSVSRTVLMGDQERVLPGATRRITSLIESSSTRSTPRMM